MYDRVTVCPACGEQVLPSLPKSALPAPSAPPAVLPDRVSIGSSGCERSRDGRILQLVRPGGPSGTGGCLVHRAFLEVADVRFYRTLFSDASRTPANDGDVSAWLRKSLGETGECARDLGDGGRLVLVGSNLAHRGFVKCVVGASTSELQAVARVQSCGVAVVPRSDDVSSGSDSDHDSEGEAEAGPAEASKAHANAQRTSPASCLSLWMTRLGLTAWT